jgi:hypothetical protein
MNCTALPAICSGINRVLQTNLPHSERITYQEAQLAAEARYNTAKSAAAFAGGVSVGAIGFAVFVCAPTLLLPTP